METIANIALLAVMGGLSSVALCVGVRLGFEGIKNLVWNSGQTKERWGALDHYTLNWAFVAYGFAVLAGVIAFFAALLHGFGGAS